MPQTLLALLALVLASLLTFNQQRLTLRSHNNLVEDEVELAAAGLASEIVALIEGRSFDEATTPAAIAADNGRIPDSPSDFSDGSTFGAYDRGPDGCDLLRPALTEDCDDVDDVAWDEAADGNAWRALDVDLSHGRTLPFEVRIQVYYVENPDSMDEALSPTRHKRVLIDVRSPYAGDDEGIYRATRVVSYDPVKADMDYENDDTVYDETHGNGNGNANGNANGGN